MCSGDAPEPDPLIGQSAMANVELSREAIAYYKERDAEMKPYRDKAMQIALDQSTVQTETARKQNAMADETRAYELKTFRPLEQKIAADALGYDTPERREAEAAQAQADVGSAADAARGNMTRTVLANGGDVNSGNFTAGLAGMSGREIALQAASGNQARKNVETVGAAKVADAANLGRGIASTNATQTQLGLAAGNSSIAAAQAPGNIGAQQVGLNNQTTSAAMQGNSSAGNLLLGQYNATNKDDGSADTMKAVGQIAGTAAMFFSDKNMKKGVKSVKGEVSLAAVRKMPVKSWKYKKGSAGDDGGKRHTGPMAQDAQKALGDAAAPGGKKIDLISMMGHTVNAVKELDKKVTLSLANAKRPAKA